MKMVKKTFSFHFKPHALSLASEEMKAKYKEATDLPENIIKRSLPKLLKEIEDLENEKEAIKAYADKLKSKHIKVLSSEYPYQDEKPILLQKVSTILEYRYNNYVGRRFWSHFQHRPEDEAIQSILTKAFNEEASGFLSFANRIRKSYEDLFNGEQILLNLALSIAEEEEAVDESMESWKIKPDSQLYHHLWRLIVLNQIGDRGFIERQIDQLESILKLFPFNDFKRAMDRYINSLQLNQLHDSFMEIVIDRLGNPVHPVDKWEGMSKASVQKTRQWVFGQELKDYLDNERFDYWKQYLHLTDHVKNIADPPVSTMYFGDFVVVEFAKTGNAAYFYYKDGFERTLAKNVKHGIKEYQLKDQYAAYFIHKLNHSRNWQGRFTRYMNKYLNNDFEFKHYH